MEFNTFYSLLTSILLLTACVRSSVVPDSDQAQTCTTSCQGFPGPAGINGIPGMGGPPGNIGSPGRDGRDGINGRDGLKGDSGSKGGKGEVGSGEQVLLGPQGPSGERGELGLRGHPGKVGPRGFIGSTGSIGLSGPVGSVGPAGLPGDTGIKGDKGSTGSTGESGRLRESAFTVHKTRTQTALIDDETVKFNAARVNIGNHFDLNSNRFTCQIPGTYFFAFSVFVTRNNSPDIFIMMDGNRVAHARNENAAYIQIGSSTMFEMEVGNQVWLQFGSSGEIMEGDNYGKCQFSGFLLYEH